MIPVVTVDLNGVERLARLHSLIDGTPGLFLHATIWKMPNRQTVVGDDLKYRTFCNNLGYSRGIHHALDPNWDDGQPIIVVNPDLSFEPAQFWNFRTKWIIENGDVPALAVPNSIVFPRILFPDGEFEGRYAFNSAFRQFFEFIVGESVGRSRKRATKSWASGSFFLTSVGQIRRYLPADDYFLYAEDLAFALRSTQGGSTVLFDDEFVVEHERGFRMEDSWKQVLAVIGISQLYGKCNRILICGAIFGAMVRSIVPSRRSSRKTIFPLIRYLVSKRKTQMQFALQMGWATDDPIL